MHVLEQEQWLPMERDEAWAFFSSARNLALITPPDMGFVIRPPFADEPLHTGQRISYTVRPLFGIPLNWVTLITEVDAHYRFVDTQEKGPYVRWWHQHTFTELRGGTWMHDRVEYELPLGPLGLLAHASFVKRRLDQVFRFRREALERLFVRSAT